MSVIREFIRQVLLENLDPDCPDPKAIFMAGGPGSGKSTVLRKLGIAGTIKVVNADDAYEAGLKAAGLPLDRDALLSQYKPIKDEYMSAVDAGDSAEVARLEPEYERLRSILSQNMKIFAAARKGAKEKQVEYQSCFENFLVDGTAGDFKSVSKQIRSLIDAGYDVAMIYVDVPLEVSIERNRARGARGGRRLADSSVEKSWSAVNRNRSAYEDLLGDNFFYVDASEENFDSSIAAVAPAINAYLDRG